MKKMLNIYIIRLLTFSLLIFFIANNSLAQCFVLNLEGNPLVFSNANKTLLFDAGNGGKDQGSIHKYSNVITKDGITVYAKMTILETHHASIINFDDDNSNTDRFQPRIGTTANNGGYIVYQLEFFDTDTDADVFLLGYYMTGVDIDGNGNNNEYVEVGGYSSYQVDATSGLIVSTNSSTGRTQFKGISHSLPGVTFDNTAAFIAYFTNPNNRITFALGQTHKNQVRYYSVQFGAPGGVFTNPNVVNNPLPIAIDDIGVDINTITGGVAVPNVLDNDVFNSNPINPGDVTISLVTPASNNGVVLNTTTGEVTVASGTPVGSYQLTYKICMNASPSDCDIAIVSVNVVTLEADLSVTKSVSDNPVEAGQTIAYTITITNNGPDYAENVVVSDILDPNLSLISATPSIGSWSAPNWTIGHLDNGTSSELVILVKIDDSYSGDIDNTATVSSTTNDPDITNNSATISTTVNLVVPITNIYPATGPGTLAFEDLWPGKGDYDFNDLVIDYQFNITTNSSNMIENMTATFTIKAFGAGLENGFGFQLSDAIDPADVTASGSSITENYITLSGNGTESGQSKSTIIVFDNAYNEMPHPGIGIGVNTTPGAPYVTPKTIIIDIAFTPGKYSFNDLDISNFNPFLIVNQTRGHEVHLFNYPPTDLVDNSLFNTVDDASDPNNGEYYKTSNNLPWAINIYESFDYPQEKQEITGVHLKFAEWATSSGTAFPDWYKDLSGYRNQSLIYVIP